MISGFTRQELTGPFMCDYCGSRFRKYDRSFLTLDNASFLTIQQKRKSKKVVVFQLLFQTEIISLPPMTLTSIPEFDKKSLINNLAKFQFGHESRRNKFNFEIWSIKHPFISPNRAYFNDFCIVKKRGIIDFGSSHDEKKGKSLNELCVGMVIERCVHWSMTRVGGVINLMSHLWWVIRRRHWLGLFIIELLHFPTHARNQQIRLSFSLQNEF